MQEGNGIYDEGAEEIVFEIEALDLVGDRITYQFVDVDRLYITNEEVTQQASTSWDNDAWKVTVEGQDEPADDHEFELSLEYTWSGKVVELNETLTWEELKEEKRSSPSASMPPAKQKQESRSK